MWVTIDNFGRFNRAVPHFHSEVGAGGTAPHVDFKGFSTGLSIDAYYHDVGAAGEASIELLSALVERPSQNPLTPPMAEFLDAVESHGSLPAPGLIYRKLALAADEGDARAAARVRDSCHALR